MQIEQNYLWTSEQYRLNLINTGTKLPLHWLFLPGGPGLGSEYLHEMAINLKLPGTKWLVDFPGDGSNRFEKEISQDVWVKGLINLTKIMQPCILVTHSFSGMFALSVPEIENYLHGFIIMCSSPNHIWFEERPEKLKRANPNVDHIITQYIENKNDENFKNLVFANVDLFFNKEERIKGIKLIENLPFNYLYFDKIQQSFHPSYQRQWFPKNIPTLIMGGQNDVVCPLSFFLQEKDFVRPNIEIVSLPKAGHFPWLYSFEPYQDLYDKFINRL